MAKAFKCTWNNIESGIISKIYTLDFKWAGHTFQFFGSGSCLDLYIVIGVSNILVEIYSDSKMLMDVNVKHIFETFNHVCT
jgi:hypothetical protein